MYKADQFPVQTVISVVGQSVANVDLFSAQDVKKASMWQLFKRYVEQWMTVRS